MLSGPTSRGCRCPTARRWSRSRTTIIAAAGPTPGRRCWRGASSTRSRDGADMSRKLLLLCFIAVVAAEPILRDAPQMQIVGLGALVAATAAAGWALRFDKL